MTEPDWEGREALEVDFDANEQRWEPSYAGAYGVPVFPIVVFTTSASDVVTFPRATIGDT